MFNQLLLALLVDLLLNDLRGDQHGHSSDLALQCGNSFILLAFNITDGVLLDAGRLFLGGFKNLLRLPVA
ncbi:hypothetical protein D3C73_1336620 [compost metagenome]